MKMIINLLEDKNMFKRLIKYNNKKNKVSMLITLNEVKDYLGVGRDEWVAKVQMTPEQALYILEHCNRGNRRVDAQHVDVLRRDMNAGHWYSDVDHIGFSKDGRLVNGQHRLRALSQATVRHVELKIDFDVEQHLSMDAGRTRTYAEQVRLIGQGQVMFNGLMPNRLRVVVLAGLRLTQPDLHLSHTELSVIWKSEQETFQLALDKGLLDVGPHKGAACQASLLWALFAGVKLEILLHVRDVLQDGLVRGPEDAPIIRLRDQLMTMQGHGRQVDIRRAQYTQHCIHMVVQGKAWSRLPANPQLHYQDAVDLLVHIAEKEQESVAVLALDKDEMDKELIEI